MGGHGLVDQHLHAANGQGTRLPGQAQQLGLGGVVHRVEHGPAPGYHLGGDRALPGMGVHAHAGGVEEQVEGAPFPAAESLQFLIGVHLQAEVPIPPPAQVGGHFLGQGHRFGLGALPAGDGQVQIPLAGGRLSKRPGETSKRLAEDDYAKLKYDAAADLDRPILERVAEVADKRGVSMTEVALAWLLTKVTAPVVGATKLSHVEGAARAADLRLSQEECRYLEALYRPHALVGVMAQNTPAAAKQQHVWSTGDQQIAQP